MGKECESALVQVLQCSRRTTGPAPIFSSPGSFDYSNFGVDLGFRDAVHVAEDQV